MISLPVIGNLRRLEGSAFSDVINDFAFKNSLIGTVKALRINGKQFEQSIS